MSWERGTVYGTFMDPMFDRIPRAIHYRGWVHSGGRWATRKRKDARGWSITHQPTGKIAGWVRTVKCAKRVCSALEKALGDRAASDLDNETLSVVASVCLEQASGEAGASWEEKWRKQIVHAQEESTR